MKSFSTYKISDEHSGLTVEQYLKQVLQISGRKLQQLTRQKGILLNGRPVYLQKKISPKDTLKILNSADTGYGVAPEPGTVDILYEDDFLLVLNKPPYRLVHPSGQTTSGTLANFLANHFQEQGNICTIRPLHRLDRETSGCVIFAKNGKSQTMLEQQLKDRRLKRLYWSLVQGRLNPPSGSVDSPIGRDPARPNRRMVTLKGESAVTHYRTLRDFGEASLVELSLDTGRTHQIRLHMAHLGHPVIGDAMYGTSSKLIARQALHAVSVSFKHLKDNKDIIVQAPLPDDIARILASYET